VDPHRDRSRNLVLNRSENKRSSKGADENDKMRPEALMWGKELLT
jgi:hypothetical protein